MYFARKTYNEIKLFLFDKEIIVIHGSRQVGKTSLMLYIIEKNKRIKNSYFFIDLEEPEYLELCNSGAKNLVEYLIVNGILKTKRLFLFIDEIQYLDNPSSFLKLLHDKYNSKIKIIVSGSSTFAIKSKFKDSLVGRTVNYELLPLSFEEFLLFKNVKVNLKKKNRLPIVVAELKKLFLEFVKYGGYPGIVLEENFEKKTVKLNQIILTYIKADLRDLGRIVHLEKFNKLLELLSHQIGNLVNIKELSNTLGIARQTVEEYLFMLENTFVIKLVKPYYTNRRTEVSRMPKVYFEDTGIANLFKYKKLNVEMDGYLFENAVFNQLRKEFGANDINFMRTIKKHEVDFMIRTGDVTIPIEVKMSFPSKRLTSLIYFKENGYFNNAYLCCYNDVNNNKYDWVEKIFPWELKKDFLIEMNDSK